MRNRQVEAKVESFASELQGVREEVSAVRLEVIRKLERLDAWLITHDPSTRAAAEAYDGLRKQVAAGAKARRLHLVDLAKLDDLLRTYEERLEDDPSLDAATVISGLRDHLGQAVDDAGLETIEVLDDSTVAYFEIIDDSGDDEPNVSQVSRPAYVDRADGNLVRIRHGRVRLMHDPTAVEHPDATDPSAVSDAPEAEQDAASPVEPELAANDSETGPSKRGDDQISSETGAASTASEEEAS